MRHEALPQSMTAEQLGVWLADNNIDKKFYNDETPYTEEEIVEFEHKSSLASRALDRLDSIEKEFKEILRDGCEEPIEQTIPPTKGRKILDANRKFADTQIEQGYNTQDITLYGMPFSKKELILYFDVEGQVWDNYTLDMTPEQKEKYVGLFVDNSKNTIGEITGVIEGDDNPEDQGPDDESGKTPPATPKDEIEGDMGAYHVGKQARLMSQALRKLTAIVAKSKTAIIFINQIRMKIGVMFGNPETTPGGRALKFYSSVRLDIRRIAQIKKGDEVVGSRTRVKVVKNKVAAPFKQTEFDIIYNEGISKEGELLVLGEKLDIIKKNGASYSYIPKGNIKGEIKLGRGYDATRASLKENKKLCNQILKEIRLNL